MTHVQALLVEINRIAQARPYITRVEWIVLGQRILKVRLHFTPELFVQVYRNDRFNTTNLVLIHGRQRLYGRDELNGVWHRHPVAAPEQHDTSSEGQRPVTLDEFMDEVEQILLQSGLA